MAQVDVRLRAWGWLTRRMASVGTMSEADVIALQARRLPANAVIPTRRIDFSRKRFPPIQNYRTRIMGWG